MAAIALAEPGTEYGPCVDPCDHHDCASTRALAATICATCDDPIGYGRRFFQDGLWATLWHASCPLPNLAPT